MLQRCPQVRVTRGPTNGHVRTDGPPCDSSGGREWPWMRLQLCAPQAPSGVQNPLLPPSPRVGVFSPPDSRDWTQNHGQAFGTTGRQRPRRRRRARLDSPRSPGCGVSQRQSEVLTSYDILRGGGPEHHRRARSAAPPSPSAGPAALAPPPSSPAPGSPRSTRA